MPEVVVAALVRSAQVLLVHRTPDRLAYPDTWDLPGGHVEEGESELTALARELREELGVDMSPESATHLGHVVAGTDAGPLRLSVWLVAEWVGTPANVAPEEHDDLRWFAIAGMPTLAHASVRAKVLHAMGFAST